MGRVGGGRDEAVGASSSPGRGTIARLSVGGRRGSRGAIFSAIKVAGGTVGLVGATRAVVSGAGAGDKATGASGLGRAIGGLASGLGRAIGGLASGPGSGTIAGLLRRGIVDVAGGGTAGADKAGVLSGEGVQTLKDQGHVLRLVPGLKKEKKKKKKKVQ